MEHSSQSRGFLEIPHTADWAMQVWAEDLPSLFAEAAIGMNALAGARLDSGPRVSRSYVQQAADVESLLVGFLSELVFLQEEENLGFDDFKVELVQERLSVEMQGARLQSLEKPIKAVTFHEMKVSTTMRGFEVQVVFDV